MREATVLVVAAFLGFLGIPLAITVLLGPAFGIDLGAATIWGAVLGSKRGGGVGSQPVVPSGARRAPAVTAVPAAVTSPKPPAATPDHRPVADEERHSTNGAAARVAGRRSKTYGQPELSELQPRCSPEQEQAMVTALRSCGSGGSPGTVATTLCRTVTDDLWDCWLGEQGTSPRAELETGVMLMSAAGPDGSKQSRQQLRLCAVHSPP